MNPQSILLNFFPSVYFLWPRSLALIRTGQIVLWWVFFNVQEHPKAQLAVVLILKRLRRRGRGLKSHPTDLDTFIVCGHVPWLYQYWPGGFMVLWVFYVQEHPKAQLAVVLILKCLRRLGL